MIEKPFLLYLKIKSKKFVFLFFLSLSIFFLFYIKINFFEIYFFAFFHVAENCHKPRSTISTMKTNEFAYMSKKIQIKSYVLNVHVMRTNIIHKLLKTHLQKAFGIQ